MFSSRLHARIHCSADGWFLEDCDSTNGTFIELRGEDERITGTISIQPGELFRVGRTWMLIEPET
jgi:pSer/pThr/pTyr-binding forkhead associated (FHA) protein